MKTALCSLLVIAGCAASDSTGGNPSRSGGGGKADGTAEQVEIVVRTDVARLDATVACVESFNAESESNGVRLWFHPDSFADAADIKASGLSSTYVAGGATCSDGLPIVTVGQFDTASAIHRAVSDAAGYVDATVVFYNRDELEAEFQASTTLAFEAL